MRVQPPPVSLPWERDAYADVPPGVLVPRAVLDGVFRFVPDDDEEPLFSVTVDAEVSEGAAVCTRLVVEPGTQPITRRLLTSFDPQWCARWLLSAAGQIPVEGGGPNVYTPDSAAAWNALGAPPRRRRVTKTRLAEVAAAYRQGGAKVVMRDCNVSEPQAYRLIRAARDAGVLAERGAEEVPS